MAEKEIPSSTLSFRLFLILCLDLKTFTNVQFRLSDAQWLNTKKALAISQVLAKVLNKVRPELLYTLEKREGIPNEIWVGGLTSQFLLAN